jgi:hypothetical protein
MAQKFNIILVDEAIYFIEFFLLKKTYASLMSINFLLCCVCVCIKQQASKLALWCLMLTFARAYLSYVYALILMSNSSSIFSSILTVLFFYNEKRMIITMFTLYIIIIIQLHDYILITNKHNKT